MSWRAWRVGHRDGPCDFPPLHLYAWDNRFDDVHKKFRTIYFADNLKTCLREVLADFRPNTTAVTEFQDLFGEASECLGLVPIGFRRKRVALQVEIDCDYRELVDIEALDVRKTFEEKFTSLLNRHGIKHLDTSELRGKDRVVTQTLARSIYDADAAGVRFRSHLDSQQCYAIFERSARFKMAGFSKSLLIDLPELLEVCREFKLELEKDSILEN